MGAKSTAISGGILLYRRTLQKTIEVFLIHPGGPYFTKKDAGVWSIPKGELDPGENHPFQAAIREFCEETGFEAPETAGAIALLPVRILSGKTIYAWAIEGDADPAKLHSNLFEMEWPPKSGRKGRFPEADRGGWFSIEKARAEKIHPGQIGLLDQLERLLTTLADRPDSAAATLPE